MSVPVDWEKYKKTKLTFYESPVNYLKNASNRDHFYLNDGTVVNASKFQGNQRPPEGEY